MAECVQGSKLARNQRLHDLLAFAQSKVTVTSQDIFAQFGWSESRIRTALLDLVNLGFMEKDGESYFDGSTPKARYRYRFKVLPYSKEQLHRDLPVSAAMMSTSKVNSSVRRDPLDIYLMGHGIAPSILFRNNHA